MNLTDCRAARFLFTAAGCAAILIAGASESLAHRRPWRHVHRRPVLVVSRPVSVKHVVKIDGRACGTVDFSIDPAASKVYVDGKLRGTVNDFDGRPGKLHLLPGLHEIVLRTPDGEKVSRTLDIRAGTEIKLKLAFDERAGND